MALPPAKKICLAATGRGKKNAELHSAFEALPVGKLRCKLCYAKWFQGTVLVAVGAGKTEDWTKVEVAAKVPPLQSVPSYVKTCTRSMKNHILVKHPDTSELRSTKFTKQPCINAALVAAKQRRACALCGR